MLEIRGMKYSPRNITVACDHKGLTHFGGVYFFHEFLRVLQLRHFLARQLRYRRQNHRYSVSQMILALVYPLVLGLDRLETASFLRSNGTFQYLTGLPSFPDPQTLRRFLLQAPVRSCPSAATVFNVELRPVISISTTAGRAVNCAARSVRPCFRSRVLIEREKLEVLPFARHRGRVVCAETDSRRRQRLVSGRRDE